MTDNRLIVLRVRGRFFWERVRPARRVRRPAEHIFARKGSSKPAHHKGRVASPAKSFREHGPAAAGRDDDEPGLDRPVAAPGQLEQRVQPVAKGKKCKK